MRTKISVLAFILALAFIGKSDADEINWPKVDAALGKTASVQGEVHRYGIPRTDLQVTLDGVTIKPALALGGWLGFEPTQDGTLVMGDLVLTETEVNPVMTKLLESGIEITAVHNHLMRASPATFYMHIHGHGDPVAMATAIRAALAESATPFGAPATPPAQAAQIELDTDKLDAAIGVKGKVNGGVYQFSVPRRDPITEDGQSIPPALTTGGLVSTTALLNTGAASVTIGGKDATVIYSLASPGFAGLYQTAVTVPDGLTGSVPLVLKIGGASSNSVNVAVQ